MATNFIQSVNLLPDFLQTDKNTKFLASTIDQLIQKPQLERLDGYIGSTNTPTYTTSDVYISEFSNLRTDYQLTPSLIVQDELGNISSVVAIDDLVNEINLYGGNTDNFDRLFRSDFYSYDPKIDWDKLVNYQQYYWLINGPDLLILNNVESVVSNILGRTTYSINGITLSNGMKISFDNTVETFYQNKEFFVEGVGTSIVLIDLSTLTGTESVDTLYTDSFDASQFDQYPFDGTVKLPLSPDYITINRASQDLNPWTRNNRWVHADVIAASAAATNQIPVYPSNLRATRPIIEFAANLKLYNFGTSGIPNVDYIDNTITDVFSTISGSTSTVIIDGVSIAPGTAKNNTVIFLADNNPAVAGKIYQINYITIAGQLRLTLTEIDTLIVGSATAVNYGKTNAGTSWWYNGLTWIYAQQYTTNNQAPLFDLFDDQGHSYSDTTYYSSNFTGNQIFGYGVGTGISDPVLGFPLQYKNNLDLNAAYLFQNYFMNDTITIIEDNQLTLIPTKITYFKIGENYFNVWNKAAEYPIPVLTSNLTATTSTYYNLPLGLTNNPLNGPIKSFTLSDLTNHVNTMASNTLSGFVAANTASTILVPGNSNLRDIGDISIYGSRLISNINPMPYAHLFIGTKENSVIDALTKAADQYNQFKMGFLKKISAISIQTDPVLAVDTALSEMNANKTSVSSYYFSDMVPYGTDFISRTWTVINSANTVYPITSPYDPTALTLRAILVYVNGTQLIYGQDYEFVANDPYVQFLITLNVGDVIIINDFTNTKGNYIPSTPTKLGLYPKFTPRIFLDNTYIIPVNVIQGHDGSIMTAYNDHRDEIILEFEKRIYNNIKSNYRSELLDINVSSPGAYRTSDYSIDEINTIIQQDFIKWANYYGIDYTVNTTFNQDNYFTWNYTSGYNNNTNTLLFGSWRAIYKYFYDTDRPHTNPWEMLGFSEEPSWWVNQYGEAPYTSNNDSLWDDLEAGSIAQGPTAGINTLYARPGLSNLIPVDNLGNLIDPITLGLAKNVTSITNTQSWKFGDQGAGETAWRRSSYWPFVVQKMLALTRPATYASLMYDPININKNIAGQWTYGSNYEFLNLKNMPIQGLNDTLTSGYSVYVSEIGRQRTGNYNQNLYNNLTNLNVNLFYKVGGFVNNTELQVIIDAVDPTSTSPGSILQPEDYSIILNVSNPIRASAISGIIIQKNNNKFLIKGYDTQNPYFSVYTCIRNANTPTITIGGVSTSFLVWAPSISNGDTGLTSEQTTTANSAASGTFYQKGQIVFYNGKYYVVQISHKSGPTFDEEYFQQIASLPITGGTTVQIAARFDKSSVEKITYGTELSTIQQVYDLIIGYGAWLQDQGFSFVEYNSNLQSTLNWDYTSREFLYWTTQNWADQSVIALSPFANQIVFNLSNSVVDNIFDSFYQYNLLQANGVPFPQDQLSVTRNNGICTIQTLNSVNGIYFARLNSVQKEHAMVFNNSTIFNDTIYDIETGYRQERMKLVGFKTANWNGDYFSPGFIYDQAVITNWKQYTKYIVGDVVYYVGNYYSAARNLDGSSTFDFTQWNLLGKKPVAQLLPNFDYKISQFEDFYSLNINNFDSSVQQAAQNLIGYTPRNYLNNIFSDPIAQYKFYQGFIREKGTKNAITKLARASINTLDSKIEYNEEWAFRVGYYGSYSSFNEIEVPLIEGSFVDNPQIISFVDKLPSSTSQLIEYALPSNLAIVPQNYQANNTFVTTSSSDIFRLDVAGYPRIDDVDSTIFNQDAILNLTSTISISKGSTIWLGNTTNNDWDVLRYTLSSARVVSLIIDNTVEHQFNLITDNRHNLSIGQFISIAEFDALVDGVYQVNTIPNINEFTIISTASFITVNIKPSTPGLLFTFNSARYDNFDGLPTDDILLDLNKNSIVWTDDDGTGNWAVYQKIKNYDDNLIRQHPLSSGQKLGWSISKKRNSNIFLVGAPGYMDSKNSGNVSVYLEHSGFLPLQFDYGINNNSINTYCSLDFETGFGQSVIYDDTYSTSSYGLMFVGAPLASNVKWTNTGTVNTVTTVATPSINVQEGLVKISSINPNIINEVTQLVLASPYPNSYEQFGHSLYEAGLPSARLLLVGAPQTTNSGPGNVYAYWISTTTNDIANNISYIGNVSTSSITRVGSLWGNAISGSANAEYIAIGAPGYFTGTGLVSIFAGVSLTYSQTIISPFGKTGNFGESIALNTSGNYLFVSAPNSRSSNQSYGKVAVYNNESGIYTLTQIISNPIPGIGMKFGQAIDVNSDATELTITALGTNKHIIDTFDVYSRPLSNSKSLFNTPYVNDSNSILSDVPTTFDLGSTTFFDTIIYSGTAYVYNRKQNLFKLAEELVPLDTNTGTNFGFSLAVNDNTIYVGAPAYKNKISPDNAVSAFTQYYKINQTATSWNLLRYQDRLVDVDTIQKITVFDTFNDDVLSYLEVIDPLKGKIAGIADQELKYKTSFDPAIYSISNNSTVNNLNTNWQDSHVGELWWDLSTAKYTWYEQGELEYRRNNWGALFPGSSIDVYEWVESTLLPSQWAAQADTTTGLASGISGQPKYSDNSVLSVKQVYNKISGNFTNYYYYWVKSSIIVPNASNRRISCNDVISIISNPKTYGLQYADIISSNAVAVANIDNLLVDDRINLNISSDIINNSIPRHTEWLLLEENNQNSVPNALLEKKLFDSLMGHDNLGNPVPDPALSQRQAYGIEIRPRQSMFKNRITALRNVIEFTNNILINERIVGSYSFENLDKQELPPDSYSNTYDQIVEDDDALSLIDTTGFVTAIFTCTLTTSTGQILGIDIINSGMGYLVNPTVTVEGDTSGALITTEINTATGAILSVSIINPGAGFVTAPTLTVRPYTVIVQADFTSNGKWAIYSYINNNWIKVRTQLYNTTLYWNYVDWISPDYNKYINYAAIVNDIYGLNELTSLSSGDYVKINNGGLGNYIIVEKVESGVLGNFNNNFNVVYSQNGTIQISNNLWDIPDSNFGFDEINTWDQTLYDQIPDLELKYILAAIKEDLFINDLKVNWNLFFFTAVKYALSEQKQLDWAFKTSFISAINYAGELSQPPVYKLLDTTNFEDYVSEVKPYHTQIREFITDYTVLEPTNSYTTDFDLPSYYDNTLGRFNSIQLGNPLLSEYPWKSWADNYTYQIGSIEVAKSGSGYTSAPTVVITTATGDTGSGAKAVAYISLGKVSQIEVIDSGSGYVIPPVITIVGGGAITTATAYPYLSNNVVREPTITMKFDRISSTSSITTLPVVDSFIANGQTADFILSWPAVPDKTKIKVTNSSTQVFPSDYTIIYYSNSYNGFNTVYSKIVFLNYVPAINNLITVSYIKNINVLTAADRILNYYSPTSGMPGVDLAQVMTGIEYPGTNLQSPGFFDNTPLDTEISGGDLGYTVATGTETTDIIIDGDGFITPNTSYGPEELIPGEINESLGINVYTKNSNGSPIVLSSSFDIFAGITAIRTMSIVPPDYASILVAFEGTIFTYVPENNFSTSTTYQYSIDWQTNQMIIPPQPKSGKLSYSIVQEGGLSTPHQTGFIDFSTVNTVTTSTSIIQVRGISGGDTVNSAFVTINGQSITTSTITSPYYSLIDGIVTVYGLPAGISTITAWFFGTSHQLFNEINEQVFEITEGLIPNIATPQQYLLPLTYPPGNVKPEIASVLVEFYNSVTGGTRLLIPPHIDYYQITSDEVKNPVFLINNLNGAGNVYNTTNVRVYINGSQLNPGFDYSVQSDINSYVTILTKLFVKDVVAILSKPGYNDGNQNIDLQNYEYDIEDGNLYLCVPPNNGLVLTGWNINNIGEIRVITYTNQDDMMIETQSFFGNDTGRFQVVRPILNENYVWVTVNQVPIVNFVDFNILDDQVTIQLSDKFVLTSADIIEIISFNSIDSVATVVGYRIFEDLFDRTHFTRLSHHNSTYLTSPLYSTSTNIYVNDVSILTPPSDDNAIPGVVLIDGERIEFLSIDYSNNVLGQLRRATLGTGPKDVSVIDTIVFDQGSLQNIPSYSESILVQSTLTTAGTVVYSISTASTVTNYNVGSIFTGTFINDGITLSPLINAIDQVTVYYGGRLLNKVGTYQQDVNISYNSPIINFNTSTSAGLIQVPFVQDLPITTNIGDAGIVLNILTTSTPTANITAEVSAGSTILPIYGYIEASLINIGDYVQCVFYSNGGPVSAIPDGTTIIDFTTVSGFVNNITLSTATIIDLPTSPVTIVTIYPYTTSNQVWVYENSTDPRAVNGYVYRGVTYTPPEFTITTSTQQINLNIAAGIENGVKLTVVQKQISTATWWNYGVSLLDSTTVNAKFLQKELSAIPTAYYYGNNP